MTSYLISVNGESWPIIHAKIVIYDPYTFDTFVIGKRDNFDVAQHFFLLIKLGI